MSNLIKRTLPVILVLAVTISCLISPAAAASIEDPALIDALQYQDSNTFYYYPNSTSYRIPLKKAGTGVVRYVEAFIFTNVDNISGRFFYNTSSSYNFTCIPCGMANSGAYLYKLVWSGFTAQDRLDIFLNSTDTMLSVNLLSLRYSISPLSVDELEGICNITAVGMTDSIHYRPTDATNYRNWTPVGTAFNSYQLALSAYDIEAYDYLNFLVYASVSSVTSVNVWDNGNNLSPIPFEISYLNNSSEPGTFYMSITVDIRSVDKLISQPIVVIEGDLFNDQPNHISVDGITGWYVQDEINPVIYWLKTIKANLGTWFVQLISSVNSLADGTSQDQTNASDFNAAVSDQQQELEDMAGVMDSVTKPNLDSIDLDTSDIVSTSDIQVTTTGISYILNTSFFTNFLILLLTFSLIGFALYGKR